jgi:hypothetical protein
VSLVGAWGVVDYGEKEQLLTVNLVIQNGHSNKNSMVSAQKQARRPTEQNEDPDINPCSYTQLIFHKEAQNTQWRKDISLTNVLGKLCKRLRLDPCMTIS